MGIVPISFAGLVSSTIGQAILGTWGPSLAGMAIVPSIIRQCFLNCHRFMDFRTKIESLKMRHKSFRLMPISFYVWGSFDMKK